MTLRKRLAVLFGVLALAVSAIVGASSYRVVGDGLDTSTDDFLAARAADLIDGARLTPDNRRPGGGNASGRADNLAFDPDAVVQLTGREGDIAGVSGGELPITDDVLQLAELQPRAGQVVGSYEDVAVDGTPYRMYTRALPLGGAIQVARSTAEDDQLLRDLVVRFNAIAGVVAGLAALAGWWIAHRTTRPLRSLAEVASTVAETRDFDVDIPIDRHDEIGTLASSFRAMLANLDESRQQQQRLVQDAGHELRTPLTSLRANVEMLQRVEGAVDSAGTHTFTPDDRTAVLAAITTEVGELSSLFDELVELATDTHDDAPLEPVRLDEIASRTAGRWQQRTGRTIVVQAAATVVVGDAALLERAITNLIGNADKFSPPGSLIDIDVRNGAVMVRDSGPGIAPDDRARIFDRFHRAAATRTLPGSGLGLAIVVKIVERHGGTVHAGESPTGGAEVGFRLPTT